MRPADSEFPSAFAAVANLAGLRTSRWLCQSSQLSQILMCSFGHSLLSAFVSAPKQLQEREKEKKKEKKEERAKDRLQLLAGL